MRVALVQLNASDQPRENLPKTVLAVHAGASQGADLVATPEVTNLVTASRSHQEAVLQTEAEDRTLAALREAAASAGVWLLIGSLALKEDGAFVNRSFLINAGGGIVARYDKIHMFDVHLASGERYAESAAYRAGETAVVADTPWGRLGLTICYDLRFPALYRHLAEAGARVLTVPSAFTEATGRAHWEVLLRARAIETGCCVIAPAQTGTHKAAEGRARQTWGHSLAVSPWGTVLADGGEAPGVTMAELPLNEVETARRQIPALANARRFASPA